MRNAPLTLNGLHHGDDLAVIDLTLPADATPLLLGEARDFCLSLIERLEFAAQHRGPSGRDNDGEERDPLSAWEALAEGAEEKMRRARQRLNDINRALRGLGYEPEQCGYGQPAPH
jgi:hypothetical protein